MSNVVAGEVILQPMVAKKRQLPEVQHTSLAFLAVCLYLFSQVIETPVIAIGPSWATWPTLSDFAVGLLALSFLIGLRRIKIYSRPCKDIYNGLLLIVSGTTLVFLIASIHNTLFSFGADNKASSTGIFQIYRWIEFILIYRVTAGIPITFERKKTLSRIVDSVFILVFLGVVGTYTSVIDASNLVSHLPSDLPTAGPWGVLARGHWPEVGTMGYNHAYAALQLIMLASFSVSLRRRQDSFTVVVFMMMAAAGVFLSGSRAGMAAMLFFLAAYFCKKPSSLIIAIILSVFLIFAGASFVDNLHVDLSSTTERQLSLNKPLESDNLSGRQDIWRNALTFLQDDPMRWLIGAGPGSAVLTGNNAHMLYLQIVLEAGVIGLFIFMFVMYKILNYLLKCERGIKPIFLATIAFLISSLTQETFYPVHALGHFMGLYLCALAVTWNFRSGNKPNTYKETDGNESCLCT